MTVAKKKVDIEEEDILSEVHSLVFGGDRNQAYGHPLDDYGKTSAFWSIVLKDKLKDGEVVTEEDAILMMCCLKISREMNVHKRDNMMDLAGYAQCLQRVVVEKERRKK
jgi:hypothetical protein